MASSHADTPSPDPSPVVASIQNASVREVDFMNASVWIYHGAVQTPGVRVLAIAQLILSILILCFQVPTVPVFLVFVELRKNLCYRVMLSTVLSEFLQLFPIFLFTTYQVFDVHFSVTQEKIVSGIYIIAWDHLIIQHFILALNRLVIIVRAFYSPAARSDDTRLDAWVFNSLLISSWVALVLLVAFFQTPWCAGLWDADAVGFFYVLDVPGSEVYREWELYVTSVFPAASISFYFVIMYYLKKTRQLSQSVHVTRGIPAATNASPPAAAAANNQQQQHVRLSKNERRILVQCIILFVILIVLILAWYVDYTMPPWTLLFIAYCFVSTATNVFLNLEFNKRYLSLYRAIWLMLLRQRNWRLLISETGATRGAGGMGGGGGGGTSNMLASGQRGGGGANPHHPHHHHYHLPLGKRKTVPLGGFNNNQKHPHQHHRHPFLNHNSHHNNPPSESTSGRWRVAAAAAAHIAETATPTPSPPTATTTTTTTTIAIAASSSRHRAQQQHPRTPFMFEPADNKTNAAATHHLNHAALAPPPHATFSVRVSTNALFVVDVVASSSSTAAEAASAIGATSAGLAVAAAAGGQTTSFFASTTHERLHQQQQMVVDEMEE